MAFIKPALNIKDSHLEEALEGHEFLIFDGAMGSYLQQNSRLPAGIAPEDLNLTHPEIITAIHREYVEAGAQVITTNTFGAHEIKLGSKGRVRDVILSAIENARAAHPQYVAGDIGPLGSLLEPLGTMSFEEAYELFSEEARIFSEGGVDLIAIETMSNISEAKAAYLAVRDNSAVPVFVSMTFEEDGRTFLGTPPQVAGATLTALGADAVGINCSVGPSGIGQFLEEMIPFLRCPAIAQPNAGIPKEINGKTVYDLSPADYARSFIPIIEAGATIIGGCCGTTPKHIQALVELASTMKPQPHEPSKDFVVTGEQAFVDLPHGRPSIAVIGERINPTGKKKLKQALYDENYDYIIGEADAQVKAGAEILDVNAGLPELDEPQVLSRVVSTLQETIGNPLQIDSSDPIAIERAVRKYAGKPMINSVNGKEESLAAILPIAAKYGCAIVGLTLDEEGIPDTAQKRFEIAERIVEKAELYGIDRSDIAIDCLVMAVATNQPEIPEILHAVTLVKEKLGVRTVLGVSNVSFGMPARSLINATFLAQSFEAGLDMPILNPLSARYMDTVYAGKVLIGQDAGAADFIEAYRDRPDPYENKGSGGSDNRQPDVQSSVAGASISFGLSEEFDSSRDDVEKLAAGAFSGRSSVVEEQTRLLAKSHDPLRIINDVFIPVLDDVGSKYESGEFFLPQLMASAEAVKAGFDLLRDEYIKQADAPGHGTSADENKAIVLATVEGDIHD
ncbi:MAG: homocysteine S-methyltransferase family protein, partial [Eggerthellaceae bacterium]|nr:homocysteine S-methyltransferase family protein [Eggerthellaceae bacterium]